MGMVVNFNVATTNAQRNLGQTSKSLNQSIQRLSSGLRVNSAANEVSSLLGGMRTLAVHAANQGVNSADDLAADQAALATASSSIDRIVSSTRFNGKVLLDGSFTAQNLQIGEEASDFTVANFPTLDATTMGVDSGTLDVTATGGGNRRDRHCDQDRFYDSCGFWCGTEVSA